MEKISYNLVFNRKKRLNKRGMALVQVEAYLNRKKMYFSTKIYLKPEQWDAKRKMVKNHPNANVLNRMLYENIAAIEQTELGLWQQGKSISLDLLKNSIDKPLTYIIHSGFISGYQNRYGDNLKPPTNVYHRMTA